MAGETVALIRHPATDHSDSRRGGQRVPGGGFQGSVPAVCRQIGGGGAPCGSRRSEDRERRTEDGGWRTEDRERRTEDGSACVRLRRDRGWGPGGGGAASGECGSGGALGRGSVAVCVARKSERKFPSAGM